MENEFEIEALQTVITTQVDFLWLELTNRCNLECVHCYAESGPQSKIVNLLKAEDYKRLLDEAYFIGCRQVQFIGGEPTLNKDLSQLICYANKLGYKLIEVFTNLISLPDNLLQCFIDNNVSVATSFYSYDREVHDSITQKNGSFEKTSNNICKIIDSQLALRVGIIEMNQNNGHTEKTIAFLKSLGVTNVGLDHLRKIGRASGEFEESGMGELCGNCSGPILCVGPDGQVFPCIMSKAWPIGSVLKNSLQEISESMALRNIRSSIYNEIILPRDKNVNEVNLNCDPNCNPWCHPGQQCFPCNPNGGQPCQPNGRPCFPR